MVGGVWTSDNMVRPGAYINIKTKASLVRGIGKRGVVALPLPLSWGETEKIMVLDGQSDFLRKLGYDLSDPKMLLLREAFKKAAKVLLYRLNGGAAATATLGNLLCTAVCKGVRGNDLKVAVAANPDVSGGFIVTTYLQGIALDKQAVKFRSELIANDFVAFGGTGNLAINPGVALSGGSDGTVVAEAYSRFFGAIELLDFQTVALPVDDVNLKGAAMNFAVRMRDLEGKKIQVVVPEFALADYEGVISVKNGVVLADGTVINKIAATVWVAAATAAAEVNQSNTYGVYEGSVDVDTRYSNSDVIDCLNRGSWVFVPSEKGAVVEQDINSFVSFTPEKASLLRKNRVLRVLDTLTSDIQSLFNNYYLGVVNNDADGRNLFKAEIIKYLEGLEAMCAIKNLDKENDVVVSPAVASDSILVNLAVMPVDSIEKLYMVVAVG